MADDVEMEMLLARYRAIEKPSPLLNGKREEDSDDEDGLEADAGYVNTRGTAIRGGTRRGGGGGGGESDDSDFDM